MWFGSFCPYDTMTSSIPGIVCSESMLKEMEDAPTDFPPVMIDGVMTTYVETITIGTTAPPLSRPIKAVRVGRLHTGGAPVKQFVVYGAQHAREWAASETIRRVWRDLAAKFQAGDAPTRALLADRAILFIPVANPDGYARNHTGTGSLERLWRGNLEDCDGSNPLPSGHDPNRNLPATFKAPGAGATCQNNEQSTTFRGPAAGSGAESGALRTAFSGSGYRTLLGLNTHTHGNLMLFTEGLSPGPDNEALVPCTTNSNCTAPDLGVFYRLGGTDRVPRMVDEEDPSVAYMSGPSWRTLYAVSGDGVSESIYGTLPAGAPRFISLAVELTQTECAFKAEQLPAAQLNTLHSNFQSFVTFLTSQLDELDTGAAAPDFDLPHLHRRHPSAGSNLGEFPTLRVSARTTLTNVTVAPLFGGGGTTAADDVRAGVFYNLFRHRPNASPFIFSTQYNVCANGANCRGVMMEGPTGTVNLCDSTRFTRTGRWAFTGDAMGGPIEECFHNLAGSGATGTVSWRLTSTARDLRQMDEARLIFSYRWQSSRVRGRVLVSDNNFAGCPAVPGFTGPRCRVLRYFDNTLGRHFDGRGDGDYRTEILDIDDFSLLNNVQVRFEVYFASSGVQPNDWQIFDPVFVGWKVP
jgi:hypothetical protein